MTSRADPRTALSVGVALAGTLAAAPALAQQAPADPSQPAPATPAQPAPAPPPQSAAGDQSSAAVSVQAPTGGAGGMDIFSKNTFTVILDARLAVANGAPSFVNGGFGKTRFQGDANGGFDAKVIPMEADAVWEPRFSNALSANVSAAWQRDHDNGNAPDLVEAFVNYLPSRNGAVGFSGRVGLMWPEISLEHSTGGAWTTVYTITPSAINSWVGEEVKVIGAEGTAHIGAGQQEFDLTGAVFGWNDTSGTLLSFRGWSLSDEKATAFGNFPLPPRNAFLTLAQANQTRNTDEIDHQPGWYARAGWRPPWPFGLALFYYDNRGNPEAVTQTLQWGWRTRFWNLGLNADLGHQTRLLSQGMIGSTEMGFPVNGEPWVHTDFRSVFVLLTHNFGPFAATGRIEGFATTEHGSEMSPDNSEDGWAWTVAARVPLNRYLTVFAEALNVQSWRGTRVTLGGLPSPFESQTVFQIALRAKL